MEEALSALCDFYDKLRTVNQSMAETVCSVCWLDTTLNALVEPGPFARAIAFKSKKTVDDLRALFQA